MGSTPIESMLHQAGQSKAEQALRDGFKRRLLTFSPATYFAKPVAVSPIVCACYGWENKDTDLLVCSDCRAACSVIFLPVLSRESTDKLSNYYEQQLTRDAHEEYCIFRRAQPSAAATETKTSPKSMLRLPLSSVLPLRQVLLLENSAPRRIFRQECVRLSKIIRSQLNDETSLPSIELPENISYFSLSQSESESQPDPLLSRVAVALQEEPIAADTDEDVASISPNLMEISIALALFGWHALVGAHKTHTIAPGDDLIVCAECSFCLASYRLYDSTPASPDERPSGKKQRVGTPLDAHCHYCPYYTSSAGEQPLWQSLVARLLNTPEVKDVDNGFLDAQCLLLDALSPKFRLPRPTNTSI